MKALTSLDLAKKFWQDRQNRIALIVEDNPSDAELARISLTQMGIKSHLENTAEGALEAVKNRDFDFCLLDIKLDGSGMDGLECAIRIKKIKPKMPCMITTGAKYLVNQEMVGMVVVSKPFTVENIEQICSGA